MSDTQPVEPVQAVGRATPAAPVRPIGPVGSPHESRPEPHGPAAAASTGGGLRAAYAQFVVNPETNDVVIRIKDSATDQVLRELPSQQVEAMRAYLNTYVDSAARRRVQPRPSDSLGATY